jgi:hypothetical protein
MTWPPLQRAPGTEPVDGFILAAFIADAVTIVVTDTTKWAVRRTKLLGPMLLGNITYGGPGRLEGVFPVI